MSSEVQAIIFEKSKYSKTKAKKWLSDHKYKPIKAAHTTDTFHRYRIREPGLFKSFSTKTIADGVKLVIGYS